MLFSAKIWRVKPKRWNNHLLGKAWTLEVQPCPAGGHCPGGTTQPQAGIFWWYCWLKFLQTVGGSSLYYIPLQFPMIYRVCCRVLVIFPIYFMHLSAVWIDRHRHCGTCIDMISHPAGTQACMAGHYCRFGQEGKCPKAKLQSWESPEISFR